MKHNESDKESEALQKKIEQQNQTIEKLKSEEAKLNNYIKEFKESLKRKTTINKQEDKKNMPDTTKLTSQLNKQIENAKKMLENYQNQLKKVKKNSTKVSTNELQVLDQTLRERQLALKRLKEEIKDLTYVKRKQQKLIQKKQKDEDGQKLTKLVDEVRKNKQLYEVLKSRHAQKKAIFDKKKETIRQLQKKYKEKYKGTGEMINFQEFKERKKQKKRQQITNSRQKKKIQSVRDIINGQVIENVQYNQKNLRQLKVKKEVAQSALKNAKKRYEKEIEQLSKRLEVLKAENENLTIRLQEKRKQKEIVEKRESSSRGNGKLTPIK